MKRSYNSVAGIYDNLAKVFIGKPLRTAQIYLLQFILPNSKILIVGGGTGWILKELVNLYDAGLKIDYLDSSIAMIAKAKRYMIKQNSIRFIYQSAIDDFEGDDYDVILTPFFFDNFSEATVRNIFKNIHGKLKPKGLWLYADFYQTGSNPFLQKIMLFTMYTFFRLACNIEAKNLPDLSDIFRKFYDQLSVKTFKNDFIISVVYKKK